MTPISSGLDFRLVEVPLRNSDSEQMDGVFACSPQSDRNLASGVMRPVGNNRDLNMAGHTRKNLYSDEVYHIKKSVQLLNWTSWLAS